MKIEDYFKYYIQGSDHYLIPSDIFKELFNDYESFKEENTQLKSVIKEIREYINKKLTDVNLRYGVDNEFRQEYDDLLQILDKGVQ